MGDDTNSWCSSGFAEPTAFRRLTEGWMAENGFCPACDADRLDQFPNNAPCAGSPARPEPWNKTGGQRAPSR